MPCVITDLVITLDENNEPVPQINKKVKVNPTLLPLFVETNNQFREVVNGGVRVLHTDNNGQYSVTLPWPSEQDPELNQWQITLPDNSKWQGVVPEGVAGPVTLSELKTLYDWGLVNPQPGGIPPVVIGQGRASLPQYSYAGAGGYPIRPAASALPHVVIELVDDNTVQWSNGTQWNVVKSSGTPGYGLIPKYSYDGADSIPIRPDPEDLVDTLIQVVTDNTLQWSNGTQWMVVYSSGSTIPVSYMPVILSDGILAWTRPMASDFVSALTCTVPTMTNRPTNGLLQLGQPFAPVFTYTLTRLPVGGYREGQTLDGSAYFRDMVDEVNTNIVSLSTTTLASKSDTDLNLRRYWHVLVTDALRTPARDVDTLDTTRGILAYMGVVCNTAGAFVPSSTIFSDNFGSYADNADLPQGQWTTAGNTGSGQQRIRSSVTITTPSSAAGTVTPNSGDRMLFLGNNSTGTTLAPINGRRKAILSVNLTAALDVGVRLTFYKKQIGNDGINFAGIDVDVTHNSGTTQVIHEETSNALPWALMTADLSAYIGQTITLTFSAFDDNAAGDPVAICIDDVLIEWGAFTLPSPPGPNDITEAYIEALSGSEIVARPTYPSLDIPTNQSWMVISYTYARFVVAYPVDVATGPQAVHWNSNNTNRLANLTLLKAGVSVTNAYGDTRLYDVYLSDQVGFVSQFGQAFPASVVSFDPWGNYVAEVLADSPMLYWRFDEWPSLTLTASDSSGNAIDGVISSSQIGINNALISDRGNGALYSSGSPNQYNVIGDLTGLGIGPPTAPGEGFAIEYWHNTVAGFLTDTNKRYMVMGTESAVPATGECYVYFYSTGTEIQLKAGWRGGASELTTAVVGGIFATGTTQHVVVVFTYNQIRLYLDGVVVQTQAVAAPAGADYTRFGGPNNTAVTDEWGAGSTLDEVAFYPTELSAVRILAHYNAGIATGF